MKPFEVLTTRGKARRLRPLAMAALENYDLEVARLELILNDLNGIFRVRTADGASYLLRICLPGHHEAATLDAEVSWLRALASEPEIHAPRPVATANGEYIVTASAGGVPERRNCMLFSWLPGRDIRGSASDNEFAKLGNLMARLHAQADCWLPPASFRVRTLDRLYPFGDPDGLIGDRNRSRFDAETRTCIAGIERRIGAELERLYAGGRPRIIHADLHWGNVKMYHGRLQPLDFEDLALGFPIQDIAISLFYSLGHPDFPAMREAFKRGYSAIRPWPEDYQGQLELLIVHRGIDLFNFLVTVGFPGDDVWFPSFITAIHGRYQDLFAAGE